MVKRNNGIITQINAKIKKTSVLEMRVIGILEKNRVDYMREFKFDPERKWRFDFLIPPNVGIEIEGGVWSQGRHTRGSGFIADCEKYNSAAMLGYKVLRYTSITIPKLIYDLYIITKGIYGKPTKIVADKKD